MVDMVKKIHKKSADLLEDGEQVRAACVIMAVGQFKKSVAFGAIGGVVGAAVGAAVGGKGEEAEAGSMADSFPDGRQQILALSDRRWIVFEQSAMSGAAKAIKAWWPLDAIAGVDIEKGRLTSKLDVRFSDGSVAQVESVKGAKPEKLVEAIGH